MKLRYTGANTLPLILVSVCAVSIGTAAAQSGGRLIVLRTANFGWNIVLNLKVDGRTITNVVQGRRYDHFLPAGRYVLTASAAPNSCYSEPTSTVLNVRPAHTYVLTLPCGGSDRVVVIRSPLPPSDSYYIAYLP